MLLGWNRSGFKSAGRESESALERGCAECTGNGRDQEARGQHCGCSGEDCELGRRATQEIISVSRLGLMWSQALDSDIVPESQPIENISRFHAYARKNNM